MVCINDEFDDINVYRRKIEDLEQMVGRMGLEIGVLKQQRYALWDALGNLNELCDCDEPLPPEKVQAIRLISLLHKEVTAK